MSDTTKRDPRVLPLPGQTVIGGSVLPLPRPGELSATLPEPPPRPAAPPAPRRIGKYEVERELARGGMGIVYVARSLRLERRVALKVLQAGALADVEEVERFLIEARAAARLRHPNIVHVHEVDRDGATWFLAMDLIEGESLRGRVLRDGPRPLREAAAVARDVARALHYAHERGLIHRDMKPHNVLLDPQGVPYVTDFGLAKEVDRQGSGLTVTGQVLGTPAYMPPEQALGDLARVDRRSDVYSLGATLYELLAGRPPFAGANAVAILRAVVEDDPTPPSSLRPEVDRDLETIVLACLAKDSARRYDTCAQLAEDLERWLADEPILARRPGLAERAARWARRRRGLVAGLLLAPVVLAAVAGVSVAAARRAEAEREARLAREAVDGARAAFELEAPAEERLPRAQALLEAARRWHALEPADAARVGRSGAAFGLGDLARSLGDWTRAGEAYAEALEVGLEADRAARAVAWCRHMAAARAAVAQSDPFRAVREVDAAIATGADWPEALLERARLHHDVGDRAAALRDYDAFLARAPDDLGALVARAQLRYPFEWREALADLDRALALRPDASWLLTVRAQVQRLAGQLAGAVTDLRRAVELGPSWSDAWIALGQALLLGRELAEAEAALLRGLELAPDSADGLLSLAECYVAMSDPRAIAAAERARERLPGAVAPRLLLASARIRLGGDVAGARREIEELLRRHPSDPEGLAIRAEVRMAEGDVVGAVEDAERALSVDPTTVVALLVRAQAHLARRELLEARADVVRALALEPLRADAWLILAAVEHLRGDAPAALEASAKAIDAAPRSAEVRRRVGMMQLEQGRLRDALSNLDAALELGAHGARVARGVARLRLGELGPALEDAEAGLAAGDVKALLLRAMIREAQGDLAAARRDAEEFLRRAGDGAAEAAAARALIGRVTGR